MMGVVWGLAILALGLLAWGGQTLARFAPGTATKLNLMEEEDTIDPLYWADIRGEALWDFLTLWTLIAAGLLLLFDHQAWPYFGLIGGSSYVYFAGRGILTRTEMQNSGFRIGDPSNVQMGLIMLGVWGVAGFVTIVASANALAGS